MNVPEKNRVEPAAVASQVLLTGWQMRVTATALAGLPGDFFCGVRCVRLKDSFRVIGKAHESASRMPFAFRFASSSC